MTRASYRAYLASPHWQEFRRLYKRHRTWKCACGTRKNLDLHHLTYERLGREHLDDVTPLCRSCHAALHRGVRGDRATLRNVNYASEGRALLNREITAGYELLERERRREIRRAIAKGNQPPPPPEVPKETPTERARTQDLLQRLGLTEAPAP